MSNIGFKQKESLTALKRCFCEIDSIEDSDTISYPEECYMDASNVLAIVPKSKRFRAFLISSFDMGEAKKVPNIDYKNGHSNGGISSFSAGYLLNVLSILKTFENSDKITLKVGFDYPLTVETPLFDIILSPMIEN